jgi:hypothetical protein
VPLGKNANQRGREFLLRTVLRRVTVTGLESPNDLVCHINTESVASLAEPSRRSGTADIG